MSVEKRGLRDYLGTRTPGNSTAKAVKEFREGGPVRAPGDPTSHERDGAKPELYAITTYLMETSFSYIEAARNAYGARIPLPSLLGGKSVSEIEMRERVDRDLLSGFMELRSSFATIANGAYAKWLEDMEAKSIDPARRGEHEVRAYSRLELLLLGAFTPARTVKEFLASGLGTAGYVGGDILLGIPYAFRKKYGRRPTAEEYHELAVSSERLAVELASMHLHNLVAFADLYRRKIPSEKGLSLEPTVQFRAELFSLIEREGQVELSFDIRFAADLRPDLATDPLIGRYGCPARDARVTDANGEKTSLLSVGYNYTRELAEKYFVPHLDRYETYLENNENPLWV